MKRMWRKFDLCESDLSEVYCVFCMALNVLLRRNVRSRFSKKFKTRLETGFWKTGLKCIYVLCWRRNQATVIWSVTSVQHEPVLKVILYISHSWICLLMSILKYLCEGARGQNPRLAGTRFRWGREDVRCIFVVTKDALVERIVLALSNTGNFESPKAEKNSFPRNPTLSSGILSNW